MNSLRRCLPIAFALLLVCCLAAIAQACPGCKDSLSETDPGKAGIVRGYFWSILFMMGMPYSLLMIFCTSMYLKVRRHRRQQAASGQPSVVQRLQQRERATAQPEREMVEV